jgi:branched-chain amino acid transport system substrate-binding protein
VVDRTAEVWSPCSSGPSGIAPGSYSYHFFWGLEDVAAVYPDIWSQVPNNGRAGGVVPNDPDGQAWSANFPALTKDSGVTIDNLGLFTNGTRDFSAQISAFKGKDVLLGVPIPPDFTTFLKSDRATSSGRG